MNNFKFNLANYILALADQDNSVAKNERAAVDSFRCTVETAYGKKAISPIPENVFSNRTVSTISAPGLVGKTNLPDLSERQPFPILDLLGVQQEEDFKADVEIPKMTVNFSAGWLDESGVPELQDPEMSTDLATAKISGLSFQRTRKHFKHSSESANRLLLDDINFAFEKLYVSTMCEGTGIDTEPVGILNHEDTIEVDGTNFNYETALLMVKHSEKGTTKLKKNWIIHPDTKELLSKREYPSGQAKFLIENGKMVDYPVIPFPGISVGNIFFGDFSTILLTKFFTDLLVNPYVDYKLIGFSIYKYLDLVIRNPKSLVYAREIS